MAEKTSGAAKTKNSSKQRKSKPAKGRGGLAFLSILAIVVVLGVFYVMTQAGSIAKSITEDYASAVLGVRVTIGHMDVALKDRRVDIRDLRVANPAGYQGKEALRVEHVSILAGQLGRDLLELRDVQVHGADVFLEIKLDGTNLSDIRKNINPEAPQESSKGQQAIKVILDQLLVNGTVHTKIAFIDRVIEPFILPPITLSGIGRGRPSSHAGAGIAAGDAIEQVWSGLSRSVISAANQKGYLAGLSPDILLDSGMGHLDIVKDKMNHDVQRIKEGLKGLFE